MKATLFYILSSILVVVARGQSVKTADTTYTLVDIIDKIEQAFPSIKQYDERINAIGQRIAGATAWMAPMFSVSASNFAYNSFMWKEDSPMNQAGVMFSLTQDIPNPSRLRSQRNYYASLSAIEQDNRQWTKNILRTKAKLFFIQRTIAERKLSVLEESRELLTLIIKVAEEKYVYNKSELSVIYKARSKMGEISNMQQMQQSIIRMATIGLNTLMNQDINISFSIDTVVRLKNHELTGWANIDSVLVLQRSDIKAVNSSIQSMRNDQALKAAMRKPDFSMGISHNQMLGMPKSWSVMAGITIPIVPWTSKGWKSEIKMVEFEIKAMRKEKETMQLMARQMIAERLSMLSYEKKQYNTFNNIILPELRKNVETALLQYRETTGNLFVLLDAWDMLLMKRIEEQDKLGIVMQLEAQYEFETEKE